MALVFVVMHLYNIFQFCIAFVHSSSFFLFFLTNQRNGQQYKRVLPRLMCFFNRGNNEGTNSSKILCLMFVYFLFYVVCVRTDFVGF